MLRGNPHMSLHSKTDTEGLQNMQPILICMKLEICSWWYVPLRMHYKNLTGHPGRAGK